MKVDSTPQYADLQYIRNTSAEKAATAEMFGEDKEICNFSVLLIYSSQHF